MAGSCPHCGVVLTQKEVSGPGCPVCGASFQSGAAQSSAAPTGAAHTTKPANLAASPQSPAGQPSILPSAATRQVAPQATSMGKPVGRNWGSSGAASYAAVTSPYACALCQDIGSNTKERYVQVNRTSFGLLGTVSARHQLYSANTCDKCASKSKSTQRKRIWLALSIVPLMFAGLFLGVMAGTVSRELSIAILVLGLVGPLVLIPLLIGSMVRKGSLAMLDTDTSRKLLSLAGANKWGFTCSALLLEKPMKGVTPIPLASVQKASHEEITSASPRRHSNKLIFAIVALVVLVGIAWITLQNTYFSPRSVAMREYEPKFTELQSRIEKLAQSFPAQGAVKELNPKEPLAPEPTMSNMAFLGWETITEEHHPEDPHLPRGKQPALSKEPVTIYHWQPEKDASKYGIEKDYVGYYPTLLATNYALVVRVVKWEDPKISTPIAGLPREFTGDYIAGSAELEVFLLDLKQDKLVGAAELYVRQGSSIAIPSSKDRETAMKDDFKSTVERKLLDWSRNLKPAVVLD